MLLQCCMSVIIIVICILLIALANQTLSFYNKSTTVSKGISQIKNDWKVIPFIEIASFEGECPEGYDAVFERIWGGTEEGCLVTFNGHDVNGNIEYSQEIMTYTDFEEY